MKAWIPRMSIFRFTEVVSSSNRRSHSCCWVNSPASPAFESNIFSFVSMIYIFNNWDKILTTKNDLLLFIPSFWWMEDYYRDIFTFIMYCLSASSWFHSTMNCILYSGFFVGNTNILKRKGQKRKRFRRINFETDPKSELKLSGLKSYTTDECLI